MVKCYLTGSKGFIGTYLRRYLEERGDEIVGTQDEPAGGAWKMPVGTEVVYHLGALVRPQESNLPAWRWRYFDANVRETYNLFSSVRMSVPDAKVVLFGSGGQDHLDSWYGYTKAIGELIGDGFAKFDTMNVYRLRLFGVTGVGKTGDVINDFAEQAARDGRIKHGVLEYFRDISDVRDMVPAIVKVVTEREPGMYRMGRGEATSVKHIAKWFGVPLEFDGTRARNEDVTHVATEKNIPSSRPIEETLKWVYDAHKLVYF